MKGCCAHRQCSPVNNALNEELTPPRNLVELCVVMAKGKNSKQLNLGPSTISLESLLSMEQGCKQTDPTMSTGGEGVLQDDEQELTLSDLALQLLILQSPVPPRSSDCGVLSEVEALSKYLGCQGEEQQHTAKEDSALFSALVLATAVRAGSLRGSITEVEEGYGDT